MGVENDEEFFVKPAEGSGSEVDLPQRGTDGFEPDELVAQSRADVDPTRVPPDGIVKVVKKGSHPTLTVNVRTAWPDRPDETDKFSFIDTLSVPKLKVTNRQEITYRLLVFGDMVVYDEIDGTSGRPLSGVLGALFKVIGEGRIEYYHSVLLDDGLQVVRAKARKSLFSKTTTITIYPDGRAENGMPPNRPDLAATEELLKRDLDIEYHAFRCW